MISRVHIHAVSISSNQPRVPRQLQSASCYPYPTGRYVCIRPESGAVRCYIRGITVRLPTSEEPNVVAEGEGGCSAT